MDVIRSLHVDIVLTGVHGMDPGSRFMTPNILEAAANRVLIQSGRRIVVRVGHTKWGTMGISLFVRLDEADTLIPDTGLDPAVRDELLTTVRRLITVDPVDSVAFRWAAARALDTAADVIAGSPPGLGAAFTPGRGT